MVLSAPSPTARRQKITPAGIAVSRGHIYWANQGANQSGTTIGRANLDGSAVNESFISGADSPAGVAVSGSYIYWANFGGPHGTRGSTIGRAKLDATNVNQRFVTGAKSPVGVTVAPG